MKLFINILLKHCYFICSDFIIVLCVVGLFSQTTTNRCKMTEKRHKQQQLERPQRQQRETTAHEDEDKDGHLKWLHWPPHTSTLSSLRSPPLISSHTFISHPSFSRYSRWSIIGLCDSGDRSPTLNSPSLPPKPPIHPSQRSLNGQLAPLQVHPLSSHPVTHRQHPELWTLLHSILKNHITGTGVVWSW